MTQRRQMIKRILRMEWNSFLDLVEILKPLLQKQIVRGLTRGGVITPIVWTFIFIRYITCASYLDIQLVTGAAKCTVYAIVREVRDAINGSTNPRLANKNFPQTEYECKLKADEFKAKSFMGLIVGCVSVIDGYLLKIIAPCNVGNQKAYFSGHYVCYSVNVQTSCDANCRFIFIEVCGPGVMPDRVAVQRSDLWRILKRLPPKYVVIGDAACLPTEHLMPLFFRDAAKQKENDNFNYYGSQCQIRIEMAFGLMTRK